MIENPDGKSIMPQNIAITVSQDKEKLEIKKNKVIRALYFIGGTTSLVLAVLGVVVPGLPVTPLALLSAYLYARSSSRLYHWLLNNRFLGPRIRSYQLKKGISKKGKLGILSFMSVMVIFSSFVVVNDVTIRWVIISLGIIGCLVVWFIVPNAAKEANKQDNVS